MDALRREDVYTTKDIYALPDGEREVFPAPLPYF